MPVEREWFVRCRKKRISAKAYRVSNRLTEHAGSLRSALDMETTIGPHECDELRAMAVEITAIATKLAVLSDKLDPE